MGKKTEAVPPPPYETLAGTSDKAKEDAKSYDTLTVPPQIMDKILAVRPHAERMRLTKEYIVKKGKVIETREAALTRQGRSLADAIKRVKSDVKSIRVTRAVALGHIGQRSDRFIRGFFEACSKYGDYKSEKAGIPELIAAGEEEVRRTYHTETRKIEAEFRDAAKQLDEKFMAYVENVLAKMEESEESK
ncbi:hypothetical protein BBK36DRAFT_1156481 [Trichoderma citrinoviride]|uniref:Uncharacterized protein n=1 Tax=Trichoderma citrinoviride TaxID=58853 RepID=A0A2T4BKZ0_9HYPO|nr:hypothetical protein BBK36DRAFT_1156481 [Trichoderma citrinoviride]PTB69930.1 hypothetical protein BBK36DRAFT_1156481 [Trichoderma citrinoviride]